MQTHPRVARVDAHISTSNETADSNQNPAYLITINCANMIKQQLNRIQLAIYAVWNRLILPWLITRVQTIPGILLRQPDSICH